MSAARLPEWVRDYVGIPFRERGRSPDGADCWGVVWLALSEHYGVEVPSYASLYAEGDDPKQRAWAISNARESGFWVEEKRGLLALPEIDGPVVLLFRMGGLLVHVGLLVERPYFLHTLPGRNSVVESYLDPTWAPRLAGAFRPVPEGV